MRVLMIAALLASASSTSALAQANISASILPSARSTTVGQPATAFAAITNGGDATANNCRPQLFNGGPGGVDAGFSYQTTTPANTLSGTPNTPANIPPSGTQNYVFSLTPNSAFSGQTAIIDFICDGEVRAAYRPGLTEFTLSSDANAPDILAIGSTLSADGVARVTTPNGFIPFALSAVNIGAGDPPPDGVSAPSAGNNEATITVTPQAGGLVLPLRYDICEAIAASTCIGPRGSSATVQIGTSPSFFVVRALGQGEGVPFFPDIVRIDVVFKSGDGVQRGRTSVAAVVEGPTLNTQTDLLPVGIWSMDVSGPAQEHGEILNGLLIVDSGGGISAYSDRQQYNQGGGNHGFTGETSADNTASPNPSFSGGVFDLYGSNPQAVMYEANGVWRPRNFIRGNLTVPASDEATVSGPSLLPSTTRRIRAVFNELTDRSVTQAGIAGVYDLVNQDNSTPQDIGDITIDAQGNMTGTVSDGTSTCPTTGMMTLVNPAQNIFSVSLTLSGTCQFAGSYGGHAAQMDDASLSATNVLGMIFANQNAIVQILMVPDAQFP